MPGETQTGQERAGLGEPAADAGQFVDSLDGLGGGANGAFGEGRLDGVRVVGQFAPGLVSGWASFESVESAVAIGEDVAFGGGDADMGELGGLFAGMSQVNGPEDVHFATDDGIGVVIAVGEKGGLFGGRENRPAPSRHP